MKIREDGVLYCADYREMRGRIGAMLHDAGEVCGCTMESGLLRVRTCPGMALATELYFKNSKF